MSTLTVTHQKECRTFLQGSDLAGKRTELWTFQLTPILTWYQLHTAPHTCCQPVHKVKQFKHPPHKLTAENTFFQQMSGMSPVRGDMICKSFVYFSYTRLFWQMQKLEYVSQINSQSCVTFNREFGFTWRQEGAVLSLPYRIEPTRSQGLSSRCLELVAETLNTSYKDLRTSYRGLWSTSKYLGTIYRGLKSCCSSLRTT